MSNNYHQKLISIVVPLYNEEGSLKELYQNIKNNLAETLRYEIIFIDDGSTDNSWSIIQELFEQNNNIKGVTLRNNNGKSVALAAGFLEAEGEIIATMDADLQDNPRDIIKLLDKLEQGYDVVSGWKERKASLIRLFLTKIFNFSVALTTGIKLHDFNCSLKIYKKEVISEIKVYGELHRFLPVLAHWRGFKVSEEKIENFERKYGKSKYGLERIWRGFFDLASILFIVKYSKKPLHFFGLLGLLLFLIGLIIDIYLAFLHFAGEKIGDRPLLMLGTLMIILGIQFFSLGLLGESLSYNSHKNQLEQLPIKKVLKK